MFFHSPTKNTPRHRRERLNQPTPFLTTVKSASRSFSFERNMYFSKQNITLFLLGTTRNQRMLQVSTLQIYALRCRLKMCFKGTAADIKTDEILKVKINVKNSSAIKLIQVEWSTILIKLVRKWKEERKKISIISDC